MKKLFVTLTVLSLAFGAQAAKNASFSIESANQNEIQIQSQNWTLQPAGLGKNYQGRLRLHHIQVGLTD